jgi:hypothetical protein
MTEESEEALRHFKSAISDLTQAQYDLSEEQSNRLELILDDLSELAKELEGES